MVGRGYKKSMEALADRKEVAFSVPIREMCKTLIREEYGAKFSNADRLRIIEKSFTIFNQYGNRWASHGKNISE